ncbi:MAG: quinone-dependent dihydroorotate dehydrogenase [Bifidobacteriaceae bacterium]|nr:quinone-dependent dihydroorotate dehydrogenase [Bifidobacteriaceae bacterium]
MYRLLFRVLLRRFDPELAHHLAYQLIRVVGRVAPLRLVVGRLLRGRQLAGPTVFGRELPGYLGVAAGFDKAGHAVEGLIALGFSHVEVGTVTSLAQPGNPPPRLWRLLDQAALRNQMGFNNDGAAELANRLAKCRRRPSGQQAVIGVNIGKSRRTALAQAPADYRNSARLLARYADYLVVNVSSPNTPGLRDLQAVRQLKPVLLAARQGADMSTGRDHDPACRQVPLLVKIAPDLADADITEIAQLVEELDLAGVVATNTTIQHDLGPGGLSGPPLLKRGLAVVGLLRQLLQPGRVIIGVGGISNAQDAQAYLQAGATLVQAYTAFIYNGPAWPGRVNRQLQQTVAQVK